MHILQEFREGVLVPVHVQTIEYVAAHLSESLEHLSGRLGESLQVGQQTRNIAIRFFRSYCAPFDTNFGPSR